MNTKEFRILQSLGKTNQLISVDDLLQKSDRTLLYGFTCERHTWHVYLKEKQIYTVVYKYQESPREVKVETNEQFAPDKRLYPERCDYEFCKLLKEQGVYLPFTTWNESVELKVYYGELL